MRLTGVPAALLVTAVIVLIGVMGVSVLMVTGSVMSNPQPTHGAAAAVAPNAGQGRQKVIKNDDLRLLVKDTDRALDEVTQTMVDAQGYMVSSRTWFQDHNGQSYKYATLTIAVPADQFENTMRRLRSLGVRVLVEKASGQDVTTQYVDLQSQVTNLEATRNRLKSFLDQAKTVDDVLRINLELTRMEAQIDRIKGQMNYLSNRSAFSTITVNLEPVLPEIRPTPVPTSTPLPPQGLAP